METNFKDYEDALKTASTYVKYVSTMLTNATKQGSLYLLENSMGLYKLLHHPDSKLKQHSNDISIKVFTWEDEKIGDVVLKEFLGLGARVFLTKKTWLHYAMFDNPGRKEKFMWIEERHEDGSNIAYRVHYTPEPLEDVWKDFMNDFSKMEKNSKELVK